jgi:hypothetical protein
MRKRARFAAVVRRAEMRARTAPGTPAVNNVTSAPLDLGVEFSRTTTSRCLIGLENRDFARRNT